MRASERKGAWMLMAGIVLLGFILWIFGKCQGSGDPFRMGDNGNAAVEMRQLSADSTENSSNGHSRRAKNREKRRGQREKAEGNRKGKNVKPKIPVRDILSDTIPTQSKSMQVIN